MNLAILLSYVLGTLEARFLDGSDYLFHNELSKQIIWLIETRANYFHSRLDHLGRDFNFIAGRASLDGIEAWRMYIWHLAKSR
jgi:hypothetical protein